jgi:hypothetical protein
LKECVWDKACKESDILLVLSTGHGNESALEGCETDEGEIKELASMSPFFPQ